MDLNQTKGSLPKYQLSSISSEVLILGCISSAAVMIVIDCLLGLTIKNVSWFHLGVAVLLAAVLVIFQATKRLRSKRGTMFANLYFHLMFYYVLTFVIPMPSVYFLLVIGPAVIGYYSFGVKTVALSAVSSVLVLLGQFVFRDTLTKETLGAFIVMTVVMTIILVYVVIFLKVADDERKALEGVTRQTELERSRLLTLVNNLNDAVIACDSSLNVILSNPKAQELLNVEHTIKGRKLDSVLTLQDVDGNSVKLSSLTTSDQHVAVYTSYRLYYSAKDFVNLYIGINQIRHGRSDVGGYVILLRDITKVKTLEEERNEFVNIMSHELRTPVSIVEGGISLAQAFVKKGATAKALDSLEKAHNQSVMLGSILSSLAMLIKSEKGNEKVQVSELEPKLIIDKIKTTYQQEIHDKGLKLAVHHDNGTRTIYTNQDYLFEILQNLMTNAIKYTDEGTVTISVREHNKSHVAFSVTDTGIGISTSDQNHIFEKFWRSENYKTRKSGGTGLGLYLTRKLVDTIGARIEVESVLGKGSTFTVYVPVYDTQEV